MHSRALSVAFLTVFLAAEVWAFDEIAHPHDSARFTVPEIGVQPGPSAFSDAQLGYVETWIRAKAPECPPASAPAVAEKFLEELKSRHPEALERMARADFPEREYESMLLRHAAVALTGPHQAEQREAIALRRVQSLLLLEGRGKAGPSPDAGGMVAKIKSLSAISYRRLVDGRVDDDDLLVLFERAGAAGAERKVTAAGPAKPKELSAAEIVSEFSRRNQAGSALTHLRAYVVEGRLKTAGGEEQRVLLYKMRPDRFRLLVQVGGVSRFLLACDGQQFWQQVPGQAPQVITAEVAGSRRDLREFIDLLFEPDGCSFERLADGVVGDRASYRVSVRPSGGRAYVACIDRDNFREIGRENEDQARIRYADFRDVAGVTMSFHEEATDHEGRKGVLEVTRITPNPGLIQALFEQPAPQEMDFFAVDRLLAQVPPSPAKAAGKTD